jgi:hypothetical protein
MVKEAVVLAQRLWQWCWRSDCSGSIGATIAGALAQRLQQRQYWCSNDGGRSIGAAIALTGAVIAAALAQRLGGVARLMQLLQQRQNDFPLHFHHKSQRIYLLFFVCCLKS